MNRKSIFLGLIALVASAVAALPPVMLDPDKDLDASRENPIEATLNRGAIVFTVKSKPEAWKGTAEDGAIVKFTAGGSKGTWVANPGFEILKAGTTKATLTDGKRAFRLVITVK